MLHSEGFCPTTPRRFQATRKKKFLGLISGELRNLKASINSKCSRLQSGCYPFSTNGNKKDVSDPRNRVESYMDVTIVQMLETKKTNNHDLALAYIHRHIVSKKKESDNIPVNRNEGFVEALFCIETTRSISIRPRIQLRIYDAMLISRKGQAEQPSIFSILGTLICTQLCEQYPSSMPPLSSPPNML